MTAPDYSHPVPSVRAPLDGSLIKEAAFVPVGRTYQMCCRCVMDTTDPEITFDGEGVCSYCNYFKNTVRPLWPSPQGDADRLKSMIDAVKQYGRGRQYDCIIGLSGGVDSSFLAAKVALWGLRPLVVHVDGGWNSELAVMNIEQICRRLGFDLVTHVVDWEEMREMQLSFLRSNLANQDVPQDHAFFAALYGYAEKSGIKYVMSGGNFATESILPASWGYDAMDATHLRSIRKIFGSRPMGKFPVVGFFDYYVKYPFLLKMEVLRPLNFLPYSKQDAIEVLERDYGWRYYGGKHYESRWTRFFQAYYLPYKFGYDKRKAHFSSLIVSGQMTREQALSALSESLYDPQLLEDDKRFICKKLRISMEEFERLMAEPARHFSEFPNHQAKKQLAMGAFRTLKKLRGMFR